MTKIEVELNVIKPTPEIKFWLKMDYAIEAGQNVEVTISARSLGEILLASGYRLEPNNSSTNGTDQ